MVKIKEAIIVEGRYDKNTLSQIVDAPIIETHGFGIMKDKKLLSYLRRVAEKRGLVLLTDSDGAGFVIRNYLKSAIPGEYLKQAYIPDVYGKERRKPAPGKEGKLGVEGMRPEVLLDALRRAGVEMDGACAHEAGGGLCKADLVRLGLSGSSGSSARRQALLEKLGLPQHMSANALLEALNLLYTRQELEEFLRTNIGETL